MWVQIYRESGYEEAARATRLSRNTADKSDTVGDELGKADHELFVKLIATDDAHSYGAPHSVGLRQVVFWIGVNAPLYWWKHMDRYTIGKTQASASTMYGLGSDRVLTKDDFEGTIFPEYIAWLNKNIVQKKFDVVNRYLPNAYLQERALMMSLPTLRMIIKQRRNHKLVEWKFFIDEILRQARYPTLLL